MTKIGLRPCISTSTLAAVVLLVSIFTSTEASAARSDARPVLQAHVLQQAPVMDGNVADDPAWLGASPATGFLQSRPFERQPASQRTEVFVGFNEDTLYIGAILYDTEPGKIITADSRRDSDLDQTDSFQVILDGFHDRQNGLFFGTSPSGVEFDAQVIKQGDSGGFNANWDTSWEVKTQITDIGWTVEMAIPFRALRYGSGEEQTWGVNFQRNIMRNNEVAYWAPLDRQFNLRRVSEAGTLTGLRVPKQRNFKVTPYALGRIARGGPEGSGTRSDEEFGVDIKYSVTPSLTLDATYNTDFAQVEADEIQVNLDRFSLFFPEKRPFFLENAGQFAVGSPQEVELFFSRRIGVGTGGVQQPIEGGVRLSGKIGNKTNVGLLHMRTDAVDGVLTENAYTVARVNQELANRSAVGAIFVERDGELSGDYNRTYAVDGRWGIGDVHTIEGYVATSETPGRSGDDKAYRLRYGHASEKWSGLASATHVGEDFNPEVGFLARTNYDKYDVFVLRRYRPKDWLGLLEMRPHAAIRTYFDDTGYYESGWAHIDNHWEWRNGMEFHSGMNFTHEGVKEAFEINEGTFVLPGEYDHSEANLVYWTNQGAPATAKFTLVRGGFFGGDRTSLDSTFQLRYGDKFTSELRWIHNDIDLPVANGKFKVNVARLRLSYSFTPKILLQALVQHDDRTDLIATNIRFSWLQSANSGLYLVYNEIDDETVVGPIKKRREIALKYSRIIDLL